MQERYGGGRETNELAPPDSSDPHTDDIHYGRHADEEMMKRQHDEFDVNMHHHTNRGEALGRHDIRGVPRPHTSHQLQRRHHETRHKHKAQKTQMEIYAEAYRRTDLNNDKTSQKSDFHNIGSGVQNADSQHLRPIHISNRVDSGSLDQAHRQYAPQLSAENDLDNTIEHLTVREPEKNELDDVVLEYEYKSRKIAEEHRRSNVHRPSHKANPSTITVARVCSDVRPSDDAVMEISPDALHYLGHCCNIHIGVSLFFILIVVAFIVCYISFMSGPFGTRGAGYGLDADLARKQAAKYDTNAEAMVKDWITAVTGDQFGPSFGDSLKDGRILCNLINKIRAGTVKKIEASAMPFKQMENISNFLKGCRTLGIPEHDLFETVDLFEQKDLGVVVICLSTLGRMSRNIVGFNGPYMGALGHVAPHGDVHAAVAASDAVTAVANPKPPPLPKSTTTTLHAVCPPEAVFQTAAEPTAKPTTIPALQNTGRTNTDHGPVYGLDAELKKKMLLQHDPILEAEAVQWITSVTGRSKPEEEELGSWLHDGTVLCELVNCIRPGIVKKINNSTMPFKQMENITSFIRCCRSSLNVPEADLFETVDLYEEKNMNFVVRCIFSLGRAVQTLNPPYTGPQIASHR